jgi:hypothetical protein
MAEQPTPEQRPTELSLQTAIRSMFGDVAFKLAHASYHSGVMSPTSRADVQRVALAFDAQDQLWQARVETARVEAVEECAKVCEEWAVEFAEEAFAPAGHNCALAIRSLLTSPQPPKTSDVAV